MVGRCDEPSSPAEHTTASVGRASSSMNRTAIILAQASLRHPWCSYTESWRRCAKSLSSLRTGAAPIATSQVVSAPRPTSCQARMPGQYSTRSAFRPRLCDEAQQADATGRLFLCARCRAQVLICSCCDRGNIYCEQDCAQRSRREAQREAGRRYQSTRQGRRKHAERARAYRARQQKVTHQGSPRPPPDDVMRASAASTRKPQTPRAATISAASPRG
jgi:hypothetical protein